MVPANDDIQTPQSKHHYINNNTPNLTHSNTNTKIDIIDKNL
jgi:hypothetical protein